MNVRHSYRRSTKVSERLRLLKSKLSATEAVVRSTEESSGTDLVKASLGCVHVVDEYPSASAFAVEKSSTDGDDLKSSTIGQRLEVARESKSEQVDLTTSTVDTSGSNHAVALRARLEAMKRKGQGAASLSDNI